MPKNKLSDFDELLAKSQRLASQFTEAGSAARQLSRGVNELSEASRQLSQGFVTENDNLEAYRLLSQKNFDARKLQEEVKSIHLKASDDASLRLEGTDIEGYLAHHHDMIILAAIDEAKKGAEEDMQEMQRRWAASEWASAKSQLMESLGHRGSSWEGTRTPSAAIAGTHFTPSSTLQIANSPFVNRTPYRSGAKVGDFSNTPMRQLPFSVSSVQKAALSENNRAIVSDMLADHASVVRSINITSHRPSSSALLSTSTGDSPENAVGPFFHLLKSINVPNQGSSNSIVCDGMTKGDLISYRSLLEMLSSIVGEDRGNATNSGVPPGFFSSICFDTGLTYANVVEEKRRLLTSGAKRYLQNQMWENWSSIVDDAAVSGELVLPPSNPGMRMQQRLRSFVSYQARTGRLPVQCNKWMSPSGRTLRPASSHSSISTDSNTPLWAYIYHCLRVGDLDGAIHEIDSCVSAGYDHGELSALTVVKALADILSYQDEVDHRSLSNSSSHATPQTKSRKLSESDSVSLSDSMNQCRILYDKDVMNKHSEADPFKVLILNLLGLADREGITASAIPDFSFEDFLWANLWFVEMHRLVSDKVPVPMPVIVSPGLNSLSGASNVIKSRIGGESDFFDLVLKYGGAEHFDSDRTCPYRYATVLFCCQRFGDAIAYLWAANALIPAAHLTVVCLHYGLILPHMPLTQNPAHALVSNRTVGVSNDPTPAYLLQTFIDATVFCTLPKIAVDYLVSLDSNWLTFAQGMDSEYRDACRLKSQAAVSTALENFIISLRQDQLADVVGILQATPYNRGQFNQRTGRSAGRLDDYLDSKQIESLLARIAYHLLTQRGDAEGAIYLYQLGGRFVEATEELCNQLAKHMIGGSVRSISRDVSSLGVSGREKWRAAGQKYASEHFDNSTSNPSIVLASLEHGGKVDLVETLYILLQLYSFVDLYNEGRHGDAIDLMDTLRIIPVDEESVELLQGMMRPFLRIVADDLLLMSMDCIRNVMGAVKAERIRTGGNIGILTDRDFMYQQLTNRAKAIVHFAHKIQARLNRRDTLSSLARTEAMLE